MRLQIKGLAEIRARLEQVRVEEIMAKALAEQADRLAQAVRESLSEAPGAGPHDRPWEQTGALRDSIAATANGLEAAVGSNDAAAAPQELGTSRIPPRPFLAPVATAMGEQVARAIAGEIASALRGDAANASASDTLAVAAIADHSETSSSRSPLTTKRETPTRTTESNTERKSFPSVVGNQGHNSNILQVADNERANKQVRDIVVSLGLDKDEAQQLHRAISGRGYNYHQIYQIAQDMFGK